MNKINTFLSKTSKPTILIVLIVLTVINFAIIGVLATRIGALSNGETLLDFSIGHTQDSVITTLTNYGAEGLALYRKVQGIDLIHPLIYSILLASLFFLLFRQTRFSYLVFLPFAMGVLDYLENIFLFIMVNNFPNINSVVIQIASLANLAKNGVTYLTIIVFLGGVVGYFMRRRNMLK